MYYERCRRQGVSPMPSAIAQPSIALGFCCLGVSLQDAATGCSGATRDSHDVQRLLVIAVPKMWIFRQ